MEENIKQEDLQDKIKNLGSDTIMGAADEYNNEELNNQVEQLRQAVEESKDANDVAIGSNPDLTKMLYSRPRNIKPLKKDYKVGRNEPCPCGSGKKYKNCCIASGKYETYSR